MLLLGAAALLRRSGRLAFALLAMIAIAIPAATGHAATRTWDGSADVIWNNPFNWTPGLLPGDGDDAVIGGASNNQVRLNADRFASPVDSVILNPGTNAKLITNGFRLKVHKDGSSVNGGRIRIEEGTAVVVHDVSADNSLPGLEAEKIRIGLGGTLSNLGFTVVEDFLDIVGGTVAGTGLIELGESGNVGLVNDGTIKVGTLGAGDLTLRAEGDALLDLDGVTDTGVVLATADNFLGTVGAATLRIVGPLRDEFSGRMEIGQRDSILFSEPWTLEGTLVFLGGHGEDQAALVSPGMTVNGFATIAVESGQANIATPLVMNSGMFTLSSGTTVDFSGPATFGAGATFAMGDRDITVNVRQDVRIQEQTVDLDGGVIGSNVVWNVSSGRLLQIEDDHPEVFSATINMNNDSTLTLNGDFIFGNDATLGMSTSGATLNVGGFTRILPDVDLEGSGPFNTVNIAASGTLVLNGNIADNPGNVFHGSFVNGGTLGINGPGTSWTLGNGGTLELRNEGVAPDVQGDLIQNQGVISGDGRFAANVENQLNGRIEPGVGNDAGRLEWEGADLTLNAGSTIAFDIGGRAIGATYDRIDAQAVNINGGQLEFGLFNDFFPNSTDVFRVLDSISLSGTFDNVANGERLATVDGLGSFLVNYGVGSTFADLQIVLSDFQLNALTADVDGDNDVDGADFLIIQRTNPALIPDWQRQYGISQSLAGSQAQFVPEPSTWTMLLLGPVALLFLLEKAEKHFAPQSSTSPNEQLPLR
jgi:hypothetical protein